MLTPPSCSIWVALSPSAPQVVVSIRRRVRFGTAESRFRRASLAATEHKRQPDHGNRAHCLLVSATAMANHGPRLHLRQGESLGIGGQKKAEL
jgi:hypothetical protein